jgi:fructan beta-fructosidase
VRSLTLCLTVLMSLGVAAADDAPPRMLADFNGDDYGDWQATGEAFGSGPARGTLPNQMPVSGWVGKGYVNTYLRGDGTQGTLTSPEFRIDRPYLVFLIGGGHHPNETGIELLVDGRRVRDATGSDAEALRWHSWDVRDLAGKTARLRIFDTATGGWGHILIDEILLSDTAKSGFDQTPLIAYRESPEYYREPFRPRYHFTPEVNWMNDPNGLVYFDGEYHLFYQYNPFGNEWGHMSWGHAVSRDLVRWQHLPVAIPEDRGIMAFSGSAVVDAKNTAGFGTAGHTPLVAIYTGHLPGNQSQHLAFSNDRGRTWTMHAGNPVLDLKMADFRDPKVFWHAPTNRWLMVVALAAEKKVHFYASPDLQQWKYVGEFGPAGAKDKPNWECPDLFELPIDNEPGQKRWVLEADMGSGSIAGGSGGEYFVGKFDGTKFTPDADDQRPVRWVDYGRDFYAPISYSDIPESDGRRIWIGWMNNWETCLVPTSPWRSTMSLPRTLSLRRTADGLRLVQQPVKELQSLRQNRQTILAQRISTATPLLLKGQTLELIAEFEPGTATEFGLHLCVGDGERTTIGYDVNAGELFVDRRQSGKVDFHPKFAGRHAGPLALENGKLRMHIFVDVGSVEVFGGHGETVITDLIFPKPDSDGVSVYAMGGDAQLTSLEAWTLESAWGK